MTLLAPAALWLSLTGAAVVALYLLKIRRVRQTVPSLEFWQALAGEVRARSLFQRLKRWLSLLLWLAIVACLVLAVANPILSLGRIKPQSIVVILDNSASMQTIEGEKPDATRLHAALDTLNDVLDRRPVDDQWLLIEAARQPRVLASWTRDRTAIREAAREIVPFAGSGSVAAARNLAADLLGGIPEPLIVLISDGAGMPTFNTDAPPLVHLSVGKATDNLGISLLSVRADRQQAMHHALLRVTNAGEQSIKTQVVISIDASTVAVEPCEIEGGASWEKTLTFSRPEGGVLRAVIDRTDVLAADNEAVAILQPMRAARVRLIAPQRDAFFFERALLAMDTLVDAAESETLTSEEYEASFARLPPRDITIVAGKAPKNLPTDGAFVFVGAWPDSIGAKPIGKIDRPSLAIANRDHPLLQHLSIGGVGLREAARVVLPDDAITLADTGDGSPLMFLIRRPDCVALCLAFDVLDSDLPFRNAFPLLLRNAVLHLVQDRSSWLRERFAIGEPIEPTRPLPIEVAEIAVARTAPTGGTTPEPAKLPVEAGRFRYADTSAVVGLRFQAGDDAAFAAVNLADESESRINPAHLSSDEQIADRLPLTGRLLSTSPWMALAILAASLITLEWMTYHLRWTE